MLNLSEAARELKQSKSAIWRAVNSGRLPATRTYTGDYQIDPAELHRVFLLLKRPTDGHYRVDETGPNGARTG